MISNTDEIYCSVVLPICNGERYLKRALESIFNQTHINYELILVDNCSTDTSFQTVNSFNDSRIRVVIENDCHQVSAYNKGFREATGDYIFIFDQDDYAEPKRFTKQLQHLLKTNSDICGSFINIIDENGLQIGKQSMPIDDKTIKEELLYKNYTIFNSSVCIKKKVFKEIGYFEKTNFPSADYEFYLRAIDEFTFSNVPLFLYNWRIHNDQITTKYNKMVRKKTLGISLQYLNLSGTNSSRTTYYHKKGIIYYYNNYLSKSFYCFTFSLFQEKVYRNTLRYWLIIIIFGIPLKLFRYFNLTYSKLFLSVKKYFDSMFFITEKNVK